MLKSTSSQDSLGFLVRCYLTMNRCYLPYTNRVFILVFKIRYIPDDSIKLLNSTLFEDCSIIGYYTNGFLKSKIANISIR